MSDNLKRAESLFNRIMNQGGDSTTTSSASANSSPSSTPVQNFQSNFPPRSKFHHSTTNTQQRSNSGQASEVVGNEQSQYHHPHSRHSGVSAQQLANLPKLDIAKLTEEALASVSENDHVLPYCWTVWHHSRTKKQELQLSQQQQQQQQQQQESLSSATDSTPTTAPNNENSSSSQQQQPGVDTYLQTTNQLQFTDLNNKSTTISHVASIEQMWTMLTSIKTTYNLNIGTEFLIFKVGVNPVWEDPLNAKGGRWIFRFSRKTQDYQLNKKDLSNDVASGVVVSKQSIEKMRKRSTLIWERIVIKILTGNFIPSTHAADIQNVLNNDICGIVLSVRKDEDIISVWNSNLNFKKSQQQQQTGDAKKPLTPFQARRIICDAILRVIRECDEILSGADSIKTVDGGSNERVGGVGFEYRLHVESPSNMDNKGERKGRYGGGRYTRSNNHHHHHHNHHNGNSAGASTGSAGSGDVTKD
ncbi:hypothetical protein I9W82_005405 [Candida metapsilosis]|uniref:Translation initiation factor eIF4e n=1 Tax=Candida metapsilosis TaxID=273372 RepID=A0A8H8D9K3_9ASCO|nr:hypothetical protein I9W82_005405 [Candida metapsilosis]